MGEIMDNNDEMKMGLFDSAEGLELNMEQDIDPTEYETDDENTDPNEGPNDDSDDNSDGDEKPSEDDPNEDDSEGVAGEEDSSKEGDDSDDTDEGTDEDSPNTIYSSFASVLSEKGLLPSLDLQKDKIENIDDLTEHIKGEITNQSKQYLIDKLGEEGYNALEKGVSLSEYQEHQNNINTLDNINEEAIENDLELAKRIIQQDYLSQGMDEKRVNKLLKKSIDLGDESVIDDAKDSLESLKAIQAKKMERLAEERQAQAQAQQKQQEKIDNDLKNSIYNKDEFIEGLGKVSKSVKDKVYDSITKVVSQSPNGISENKLMKERRENPVEFDTKLYYLYEITGGFKDFSKLINKSESKAINNLESQLRKQKFETGSKPTYVDDPDSYESGVGSELNL